MYKITIQTLNGNEKTLYYPGNDEFAVMSADLSLKVGNAGEFNFTVPQSNPLYNEIVDRSIITIYEDNTEIWRGDIQDISQNFDKSLEVYALEDLAWLGDETVPMVAVENQTYAQRFSTVMANYNDNQPAKRQFQPGIITSVTTSNFCNWQPLYEETLLECIRRCIADNGYLKVRRVTNNGTVTRYIDILLLEDYGQQAQQAIRFGSNLLDFVKEIDNTNFLNVLYPYGKETEEKLYGDVMRRIEGTPIQNDASIAAFGRHSRTVIFETDSMANLNRLALAYLNRYSQPSLKIKAKAIDLGNIEDISRMHLGDSVRIIAEPFAIDQWDYITNQELDLLNIANNQIELSDAVRVSTLTSQVATQGEEIKDTRTPASVLDEAKRNAWSIIEGENGGIVTFDVNGNEQIIGIHIANNLDLDQATKAWGWNVNGLVYLHRTYPSDEWQVGIAMTMNGEIVADYITTGEMSADRINGGHIRANLITSLNGTTAVGSNTLSDFATKASTIIDVDVEYAKNQSSTTAPTSGWSTSSPQWEEGYYIWQRTKTTDGNNQASYSDPVCIQGADGQTGPAGVGVSAIVEQYYLSTSDQSPTGGSWSTNQPAWVEGKYIWTRSHVTWTDSTTSDTAPVLAKAINGANQAVKDLDDDLDQEGVMNRLTNGLQTEGIYLENDHVYINASMIRTGYLSANRIKGDTLTLGGTNDVNGQMVVKDANGVDIVTANKDGLTTTHLIATDDSEFGNLKIGKKTIEPFGVPIEVSYIYAEGYKELFWNEWSSLSKTFRKQVYFSPFYDGWTDDNTIIISFVCDDTGSHDTTQVCRITLYKWNGSSWVSQGYRRFNPDGDEIDGKSDDFGPFYKTDSDIYKLSIIVSKEIWASNYELDVYTNWQHVLEADPYETVSSFRGSFTGSAQLYSMSVGDMEVKPNGNISYDDSESNATYSVTPDGFSSASSSTNYTELTALTNPSIKAHYSSSNYIEFSAPTNPKLEIYSSSARYIKATGSQLRINYDSSQYILINSSIPSLEVNNSSDDYIYLDDTEVTIHSTSNTYATFRGSASLVASRSGTSYSIPWTASDRRFKEEIEPLDADLSKNFIDATETVKFKYKSDDGKHYGMIAQDARELLDSLGETDAQLEHSMGVDDAAVEDPRTIDYHEYIPHIINYIKDLRSEIVSLKEEVRILKEERNDGKH